MVDKTIKKNPRKTEDYFQISAEVSEIISFEPIQVYQEQMCGRPKSNCHRERASKDFSLFRS